MSTKIAPDAVFTIFFDEDKHWPRTFEVQVVEILDENRARVAVVKLGEVDGAYRDVERDWDHSALMEIDVAESTLAWRGRYPDPAGSQRVADLSAIVPRRIGRVANEGCPLRLAS